MKFATTLLPLAALATAFVVPDEQLTRELVAQTQQDARGFLHSLTEKTQRLVGKVEDVAARLSHNALDSALHAADVAGEEVTMCQKSLTAFDGAGWLRSAQDFLGDPASWMGHHGKHGKHGHHGHKPNMTVYQLINESKYTTKLASLINEYDDLVEALNGTAANYTVFAPTDKAFENAMKHHHEKPSKEQLKMILAYHVSADFYPAGRVLVTHTIPTTYGEPHIDGNRQRLRVGLGMKGLAVNFYARIIAIDIFGTNGVIHGIDHVLMPPPSVYEILELLPAEFSTLLLAIEKSGLKDGFEEEHFRGGTFFAPSNWAFQKLGPRINMFLFSDKGKKYLEALLRYHCVPDITLYSDAIYRYKGDDGDDDHHDDASLATNDFGRIPKGKFHIELPTTLEHKTIGADVARFGGLIVMRLNGFTDVAVQDGIARDGVVHELSSILLPPKAPGSGHGMAVENEGDIELEELMLRLEPYVQEL